MSDTASSASEGSGGEEEDDGTVATTIYQRPITLSSTGNNVDAFKSAHDSVEGRLAQVIMNYYLI